MRHRRFAAASAAFAITLGLVAPNANAFSDVFSVTPYAEAINALREKGVIDGYSDGTFKAGNTINRAEFLKIVLESRDDEELSGDDCFPDVNDEWFAKYVCSAKKEGIVAGYPDGSFRPEQEINFVEASKIMALAFGQSAEQAGGDWYEPYVRSLEDSNAIPLSFESLDQSVKRGEMAEMMWRLTENVTDRPAKGYLNVKYPELLVNTSSDEPQRAKSCADLRAFAEETANGSDGMYYMEDAMPVMARQGVSAPSAAKAGSTNESQSADADYSATNIQVEGVDEADIIKNDGEYLYALQGGKIRIVKAVPSSAMELLSTIDVSSDGFNATELYVDGDRLTVIGNLWINTYAEPMPAFRKIAAPYWYGGSNRTAVRIYDVSDRSAPALKRSVSFEGNAISSRRIDDRIFLVMNQNLGWYGGPVPLDAELLPKFSDSATNEKEAAVVPCADVMILPREPQPQYLIIATIPTDDTNGKIEKEVILGNATNVYSSLENLYVASSQSRYLWQGKTGKSVQQTTVYRFAINDKGVELKAKGKVPGTVLNQFSMDEYRDHFRIATTDGESWNQENMSRNNLYVLNMSLERTGTLEDLAPGEQIYSVRFVGDKTYMVTFRTIDPLFVLDTSDPKNPRVLGQLKIPGYSNYLHPYDSDHILGFGKDAAVSKDGTTAWYQGMKVALFDVSDTQNPKILDEVLIGDRGSDSPLLYDHKALLFEKDKNLLAFPVSVSKIDDALKQGNDGTAYGSPVFQGAYVYDISLDGFKQIGQITHYEEDDLLKAGGYLYGKDVERITRIGDSLYTLSQIGVKSSDRKTLATQDSIGYEQEELGTCDDAGYRYVSKDPEECKLIDFACEENEKGFSNACGCGCIPN